MFASRLVSLLAVLDAGRLHGAVTGSPFAGGGGGLGGGLGGHRGPGRGYELQAVGEDSREGDAPGPGYHYRIAPELAEESDVPAFDTRLFLRRRRTEEHRHYESAHDSKYLHLPRSTLHHLPDGEQGCQAMKNTSMLQQVLDVPLPVEMPCPVTLRPLLDPSRLWPKQLIVAECACPTESCRPRTAYVCTQLFSFVTVVTVENGNLHQAQRLVATGCRCMTARATMAPELDEDYYK